MKKIILIILITVTVTTGTLFAVQVYAQAPDNSYTVLAPLPGTTDCGAGADPQAIGLDANGQVVQGCKTTLEKYLPGVFKLAIGLSAVFAVLMIVIGGFQYMSSDAITGKSSGRERIKNAVFGLVLVISAYLILWTINPKLLTLNLDIEPVPTTAPAGAVGSLDSKLLSCASCTTMTELNKVNPELYNKLNDILKAGACKGECQFNLDMAARLDLLMKKDDIRIVPEKNSFILTEGYPPTISHLDICHYNGTCVDIALNKDKLSQENVDKLIQAAKDSGFQVLNEYPQFGGKTTDKSTGGHLHIKF